MPSLKQLQVFAAIARHGSLGAAAEDVCLSKGAVSQALSGLEQRLGTPLFDRVHPRLKLNAQGRQLQPLAEDVSARVDDIRHMFDAGGALQGVLHLGASQTIGTYVLPQLLCQMPDLDIRVEIHNTYDLCEKVAHFELDLALIEGENHHPDLRTQFWQDDDMVIVAATGHRLGMSGAVQLSDLQGCDWVLREANSGSRRQFDREISARVAPLGRVRKLNAIEAVVRGVESGLGLTFISRRAVADRLQSGALVQVPCVVSFSRRFQFVWHRQKFHGALLRSFLEAVQGQSV